MKQKFFKFMYGWVAIFQSVARWLKWLLYEIPDYAVESSQRGVFDFIGTCLYGEFWESLAQNYMTTLSTTDGKEHIIHNDYLLDFLSENKGRLVT